MENGILEEIRPESHRLTASVQLDKLPGIMTYGGETKAYRDLKLPVMEFTVVWQQYDTDILIDNSEMDYRFDIRSTFGGDLEGDFDGRFYCRAIPGRQDLIQVFFNLDGQQTEYHYPFLLNLTTGETSDPLASIDLSSYPCITDLTLTDDLRHATAMAGKDHDHKQEITIDLTTGQCTEPAVYEQPVNDCLFWFPTGEYTIFYTMGTEESLDGFLYDTAAETSTALFTDAALGYNLWEDGFSERYFSTLGGGYGLYYEKDLIYFMNLHDGSRTLLEGIPVSHNVHFFFNADFTVLSISVDAPDSLCTTRLCFLDVVTGEAWYFDRDLPDGVSESAASWYSPYGYMIQAENEITGTYYLYLYEYTP